MKIFEYGKDDVESLFESLQRRTPEGKGMLRRSIRVLATWEVEPGHL